MTPRYRASERKWVRDILLGLTPEERAEYEKRMRAEEGHHNTGKKYDSQKARVAEAVKLEFRLRGPARA